MSGRLEGKVAIVTGAGQGIGAATALAFARQGATVVIVDKNEQTAQQTARRIEEFGTGVLAVTTDVTRPTALEAMAAAALAQFGRIDILVANAGANVFSDPLQLADEDWHRCFAVDLDGVWFSIRAVLPTMRRQMAGSVIVMASCHSSQIIPGCFPYPVAKHGVLGLVRALGVQYAAEGIRVNAIAPGYIETELAEQYWATFLNPAAERQRISDLHPCRRIGRPEEVAMTAVFLASDEAPFINAAVLQIDGGRSAVYHD